MLCGKYCVFINYLDGCLWQTILEITKVLVTFRLTKQVTQSDKRVV